MDLQSLSGALRRLPSSWRRRLEKRLKAIPAVQRRVSRESAEMFKGLEESLKPYREGAMTFPTIPESGLGRDRILAEMERLQAKERARWQKGYVSGAVYHGAEEHVDFLNRVYALHSQTNPLHADVWPSVAKYEAEIVSMATHMLGGDPASGVCGTVSSGGTESILLAVKAYRDWARERKGILDPEMIVPSTAHAAFAKASQYFNVRLKRVPVGDDWRADVGAMRQAVTSNTILLVGSAPDFPHGLIDPISELAGLALERGIGFHTDACLGGFVLPWARRLGYPVPPFDFSVPGVTSISADTHKYGYAAKGTSVVLYRNQDLRHFQYFTISDWPGGLYCSPTFAGSRPGALSAACWASLVAMGESGYLQATRRILETAARIKDGVRTIPGIEVMDEPLFVIALRSDDIDVYKVMALLSGRQWSLNGLFDPPAVHLCVTLRHAQEGVAERFVDDLRWGVETLQSRPEVAESLTPIYGMAASQPLRGLVDDFMLEYMDKLFEVCTPGQGEKATERTASR
jgi:sphinganine-1-phosphate aldolase